MENDKTNAKLGFWEKILANMLEEGGGGWGAARVEALFLEWSTP